MWEAVFKTPIVAERENIVANTKFVDVGLEELNDNRRILFRAL